MHLNADLIEINSTAQSLPDLSLLSVNEARQRVKKTHLSNSFPVPVAKIETYKINKVSYKIPLSVYYPFNEDNLPCLIFFHGGGWTLNDLETHDSLCRSLSIDLGVIVVSVDYRLAPENKFPSQTEDCYLALEWIALNSRKLGIDANHIMVAGDSSGAYLAIITSILARDRKGPTIFYQLLAYPVTDYYDPPKPSFLSMGSGYSLTAHAMAWFWQNYLPSEIDLETPYLFPLRENDLTGLPPCLIVTAYFDPLRDDGEQFADKMRTAGNKIIYKRYDDQMHSFLLLKDKVDSAKLAYQDIIKEFKRAIS